MTTTYYQDEHVTVHHGDALDVLRRMDAGSVHAVVTDPPYGLEFMGKGWDAPWQAGKGTGEHNAGFSPGAPAVPGVRGEIKSLPSYMGSTNPTCRNCGGTRNGNDRVGRRACRCAKPEFPNTTLPRMRAFQDWCTEWATECLRVLKPGGHMLAFGGSRTWHRLAAAVEDAGFEIRDSIAWLYGSGFPKSLDVSKAIDKRPGVIRHPEFGKALRDAMTAKGYTNTFDVAEKIIGRRTGAVANWIKYQFPEAKWWPALRDLLDMDEGEWGPVIAEAERARTGTHTNGSPIGAFTSRINGTDAPGAKDRHDIPVTPDAERWQGWGTALKPAFEPIVVARKPLTGTVAGNVLTHGTGALNIDATRVGDGSDSQGARPLHEGSAVARYTDQGGTNFAATPGPRGGSPAGRWPTNVLLDDTQAAELDRQSGITRDGVAVNRNRGDERPMTVAGTPRKVLHEDVGYGGAGGASRFFPTFRYEAKAPTDQRPRVNGIAHPTVKPLDLMRWLVRLVTPPGGTILDPFAGSGTTLEAALIEGFQCIGIERETDYLPLIRARLTKPLETVLNLGTLT